jgi:hypothetical protein
MRSASSLARMTFAGQAKGSTRECVSHNDDPAAFHRQMRVLPQFRPTRVRPTLSTSGTSSTASAEPIQGHVLCNFPFPSTVIPGAEIAVQPYVSLSNAVVPWVGNHLFHVTITVLPNGSGDTTFNPQDTTCSPVAASCLEVCS